MHPILFKVFDFPIRSFSVMVLLGVLAGAWWSGRCLRRDGHTDEGLIDHLMRNTLLLGFLGARITYLVIHPEAYENIVDLVAVWKGGIVSYGGFFGGALGAWFFARNRKIPFLRLADMCAPGLALGQVFGRIGCFLVGDDHGHIWDGAWAVRFPAVEGSLIPEALIDQPLHPSQLYLSAMNLVIFAAGALAFRRRRPDGQVFALVLALYAVGRFAVEYTRGDDAARGIYGALSTAQWWSLVTFALALVILVVARRRTPDGLAAGDAATSGP